MTVKVGVIKVIEREFDLCKEAYVQRQQYRPVNSFLLRRDAHADIECPVEEGEHTVVQAVELPKEIPKGEPIFMTPGMSLRS